MHPELSFQTTIAGKSKVFKNAQTMSALINAEEYMVNISPKGIHDYMKHGLATWLEDVNGNIGGFIKALPWHPNLAQVQGGLTEMEKTAIQNMENGIPPTGLETGSLLIPKEFRRDHLGSQLKDALSQRLLKQYPGIPIFSVVGKENVISSKLNIKEGWIALNPEQLFKFSELVGMDVVQGWDANVFLHPDCMTLLN